MHAPVTASGSRHEQLEAMPARVARGVVVAVAEALADLDARMLDAAVGMAQERADDADAREAQPARPSA